MNALRRRGLALAMGLCCHGLFALAVGSMAWALLHGLQDGRGTLSPWLAWPVNLLLVLQFPLLHSLLMTAPGRRWLAAVVPGEHGRTLATTTFACVASLQLLATFWLWTPSGIVWHSPHGITGGLQYAVFVASWLFLLRALWDAGLGVQTGAAGWWALLRGRKVSYGDLPTSGTFGLCRQPIYLGFALVLCSAPTWSPDWLWLVLPWCGYCVLGPRRKEARFEAWFGDRFRIYRATVPYFLPRFRR